MLYVVHMYVRTRCTCTRVSWYCNTRVRTNGTMVSTWYSSMVSIHRAAKTLQQAEKGKGGFPASCDRYGRRTPVLLVVRKWYPTRRFCRYKRTESCVSQSNRRSDLTQSNRWFLCFLFLFLCLSVWPPKCQPVLLKGDALLVHTS